jgi:hypothetical protein
MLLADFARISEFFRSLWSRPAGNSIKQMIVTFLPAETKSKRIYSRLALKLSHQ